MLNNFEMFYKRKSVRRHDGSEKLSEIELAEVETAICGLVPLFPDIGVSHRIVETSKTTCTLGGEYCLLIYSEVADGYLQNVGYMFEQLDLWFASKDIGACWCGLGKTSERRYEGRKFVIMINFGKSKPEDFRGDISTAPRRPLAETWKGALAPDVAAAARYAPSAVNSQPWRVFASDGTIEVSQGTDLKARAASIVLSFFNKIDMGIYLCFLETALNHYGFRFTRALNPKPGAKPLATYTLK